MKQVNKNFLYNALYQIFILIIPLISAPYTSRVLGVDNVGIYSYTSSIVNYFMLFAMLGINNYGSRTIAKCSKDREKMSKAFMSIYLLQLICVCLMLVIYLVTIPFINYEHKIILLIQTIMLISVGFDINWFFFGMEKFKITITRNIIIKLLTLVSIFVFVKESNDLWKYTSIISIGMLISQSYLWLFIGKEIEFKKVSFKEILANLKPCLVLFIPVLSYSVYRVMDKIMIGSISSTTELGYYDCAERVIAIPVSFITALGTIMLPHMSKEKSDFNARIMSSFELCFCFIVPMIIGIFVISEDFSVIFFGAEYYKTGSIIKFLLPSVLFIGIANVVRTNLLIPNEKDSVYVKSTILGALVNFFANIILIKDFGAYGACVGTILAEFCVMFYQIIKTRKTINYANIFKIFTQYFIKGIIMGVIIFIIGNFISSNIYRVIIQVIVGSLVYFLLNFEYIMKDFFGISNRIRKSSTPNN